MIAYRIQSGRSIVHRYPITALRADHLLQSKTSYDKYFAHVHAKRWSQSDLFYVLVTSKLLYNNTYTYNYYYQNTNDYYIRRKVLLSHLGGTPMY